MEKDNTRVFESVRKITYKWWEVDSDGVILDQHIEELRGIAEMHVAKSIAKGFTKGELPMQQKPSLDIAYTGAWELKVENKLEKILITS